MIKSYSKLLAVMFCLWTLFLSPNFLFAGSESFVQAKGKQLTLNGRNYRFQAICFGNNYDDDKLNLMSSKHHSAQDYKRVVGLGFNSIRFGFNANWYVNNPDQFWLWLDQNILWAKDNNIRLILDMHVPIGSFWLDPTSPKVSFGIWDDPYIQQQNIDLWDAISKRYKDEPTIAAYDIVNEPVTTDSDGIQWRELATKLIATIRANQDKHLIVLERLYGVNKKYGTRNIQDQFLVDDDNILYDFHFYEPIRYTHQNAKWLENPIGDGGRYPDPSQLTPTGNQVLNIDARIRTQTIQEGPSKWKKYSSGKIQVTAPNVVAAMPQMVIRGAASGTVYFDEIEVYEFDAQGKALGRVWHEPLNADSSWKWWSWDKNAASPDAIEAIRSKEEGYQDNHSLVVNLQNTNGEFLSGWSSDNHWLGVTPGHSYEIVGRMQGNKVVFHNTESPAQIGFELDFYENAANGESAVLPRDIRYLNREFMRYYQFGIDNNVPMSVLETGLVNKVFSEKDKGGKQWVIDLLRLLKIKNTSYAYWNYHGPEMGLFMSKASLPPSNPNMALVNTLIELQDGDLKAVLDKQLDNKADGRPKTTGDQAFMQPPGNLTPDQVPQFVVIGFDDNTLSEGMDWAADLFANKRNPSGNSNSATFDGSAARVSFYMNTLGLENKGSDDPEELKSSLRRLYQEGHEIGNHTHNHHADINWMKWSKFQNVLTRMTRAAWRERVEQCQQDLHTLAGLPKEEMIGFRAPYLSYNQSMFETISKQGFVYDCSVEEGYSTRFDGRNFRWPYPMSQGAPGHKESWRGNPANPDYVELDAINDLWQLPNHVLIVPDDKTSNGYNIESGLWQRIKKRLPNVTNHRITGFDYNLWSKAALSKQEVLGLLRYNLDLRLEGNRAPFMFGAHSEYYVNPKWAKQFVPNATMQEMKEAISEFVDYALTKPMVRIRPARDIISWVQNPVAL